jgi:hypothetical protein
VLWIRIRIWTDPKLFVGSGSALTSLDRSESGLIIINWTRIRTEKRKKKNVKVDLFMLKMNYFDL